ncbi:metabolite traffic protein EboE [Gloeocapsopsis dulcis]|uniref:Xylose isomerase n=1 Tax=Gloeocapsopsis dulcis AAB1 = 1H9 TaxID=1433147 RepID=A0A6N8FR74_9CHRO|nr:metabolite traffic protein EboE [Gloeocapsopsis dulcis]MUL35650.1 xylose isomerase [Gloeocapsopsis dulcis AAB1 = 1H9]WNN87450.1 metabolite traffic protein EboE [Gloeocapsopsis dulcis]
MQPLANIHLTYCTNVHPGESWQDVFANLKEYIPELKARLAPEKSFGIGLRLAAKAASKLLESNYLAQFQAWLNQNNLYVFTLNGFPYGEFHHQVVKDKVYAPDWQTSDRLDYTLRLTQILAALLPEGIDGGISTLPLSYKPWFSQVNTDDVFKSATLNIAAVAAEMARIRETTGKILHLDLEPEPDGLIENTTEVIDFFHNWLLPIGGNYLAEILGISPAITEALLLEHIRICYDTCHFAVEYEDPKSVFTRLQIAGIHIGKIQISAAIRVILPKEIAQRKVIADKLSSFAESTYLHQVIARSRDGTLHHYPDLSTALPYLEQSTAQEWRTHFHVPIFIHDYQTLQSTQDDIVEVLNLLGQLCHHLEIETYTWDVLPPAMKLDLLASIQREYEWVLQKLGD